MKPAHPADRDDIPAGSCPPNKGIPAVSTRVIIRCRAWMGRHSLDGRIDKL
jgi:hypothetical protein